MTPQQHVGCQEYCKENVILNASAILMSNILNSFECSAISSLAHPLSLSLNSFIEVLLSHIKLSNQIS